MSYIVEEVTGPVAQAKAVHADMNVLNVHKYVVMGSSYSDPGPDWCEHITYDSVGKVLERKREKGY